MDFTELLNQLYAEERLRATVYAINTLLLQKGLYTQQEFETYFCEPGNQFMERRNAND